LFISFQRCAEKAQLAHGLHQFAREAAFAIAALDDRDQVIFNELARGVAHHSLFVGEQSVELDEIYALEFDGQILDFQVKKE
jgi:hypothetical protein